MALVLEDRSEVFRKEPPVIALHSGEPGIRQGIQGSPRRFPTHHFDGTCPWAMNFHRFPYVCWRRSTVKKPFYPRSSVPYKPRQVVIPPTCYPLETKNEVFNRFESNTGEPSGMIGATIAIDDLSTRPSLVFGCFWWTCWIKNVQETYLDE